MNKSLYNDKKTHVHKLKAGGSSPRREHSGEKEMCASQDNNVPVSESTRLLSNGVVSKRNDAKDDRAINSLAFGLLVQSYLLVSVFPYSGFLAMHLIPSLNEENSGKYAGFIAASFMFGRAFSSFEWGKTADKYGRVFVVETSLILSAVFSILFGLAPTFPMALILRFLLGLSNGLLGPTKTMVSEYARGDESKETRMMARVVGMWGCGFLINPAISGYLCDPIKQYPDSELVKIFSPLLEEFPFFLPNIVGSIYCLVGYVLIHTFVEETLPEDERQQFRLSDVLPCIDSSPAVIRSVSSWGLFKHLHNSEGELSEETNIMPSSSGDKHGQGVENGGENGKTTILSLIKREGTRQHLLVYWGYSFIAITIDEVFPLYCMSKTSGLGISEKIIGNILSGTGLFYVCMQYYLTTKLVDRYGSYKSLEIAAFLSMPLSIFFPISLITNEGAPEGTLTRTSLLFLSMIYAFIRSFSAVFFSTITVTTNRTVPSTQRATMNGLSMLGGSVAKSLGPLFGGIIFSTSVGSVTPPFGSVVVYSVIAALGICLGVQAYFLREYEGLEEKPTKIVDGENASHVLEEERESPPTF